MDNEVTKTDPEWRAKMEKARREQEEKEALETAKPAPAPEARRDEPYSLAEAADNAMVRRYKPRFLARGGEHIVYELPERPNVVIKVDARIMAMVQAWNAEKDLPLDAIDPEVMPYAERYLKTNRERMLRLSEYFGIDNVPRIHQTLAKVPVTGRIVSEVHGGRPPKGWEDASEAWAIVRVQKRIPELASPERKTIMSGYAEHGDPDPDVYRRVSAGLLEGGKEAYTKQEEESIFPEKLRALLREVEKDPSLRAVLGDFVTRAARYSAETKEILDLAGSDNVAVFKQGGEWKYRLVDALYPAGGAENMIGKTRAAAAKAAKGEALSAYEKNCLLNGVNYARTVNLLAERLGLPDRIDVIPEEARGKADLLAALRPEKGPDASGG